MKPTEQELAELAARVAHLEAQMARLLPAPTPAGFPSQQPLPAAEPPAPMAAEPPVLQPVFAPEPAPEPAKTREIPSVVWVAGAGAVIFLLGVIYFLTVSIQRGWISPWVRVLGGVATGAGLGWAAARLVRSGTRSAGVALLAAGLGTWTFAFYYGAQMAHLFPVGLGFAGTVVATLVAGALAARWRDDGALAVGVATGLIAPLAFSSGTGSLTLLLVYLLLIMGAQLTVLYVSRTGGDWLWSRLVSVLGFWAVFFLVSDGGRRVQFAEIQLGLVALLGGAMLVLAWLPRHPEAPSGPAVMTILSQMAVAGAGWSVWSGAGLPHKEFSVWLLGLAAVNLLLVGAARKRVGDQRHDFPLLLVTAGLLLLSVPVALDHEWVIAAWSVMVLTFAAAAWAGARSGRPEAGALQIVTALAATLATVGWMFTVFDQPTSGAAVFNREFVSGVSLALSWSLLSQIPGPFRMVSFCVMQFVAVNNVAWELARCVPPVEVGGLRLALGQLLATLVYAVTGAAAWFRGVARRSDSGLAAAARMCGYAWLGWATLKLLVRDLAGTELLFRALAALGVGAVFLGTALLASRRANRDGSER
jgi:uncharacterized membrane protein